MIIEIWWSDKCNALAKAQGFKSFVQKQANRLGVGVFQYDKGKPTVAAKYLTRLKAEIKAYDKTGNIEHLINAANYCYLESAAPEHENSHFEHTSRSVTRHDLGMKF